MIPRENKILIDLSNKSCENILSKIDPFDYDVFNPFIHINVKKSVQRSLVRICLINQRLINVHILIISIFIFSSY